MGLFVGVALAGCAPALAPVELTSAELRRAAAGGDVLVLARFHRADTGEGVFVGSPAASVPAQVTRIEDGQTRAFGTTTGAAAAGARGWVLQALPPGTYYLTLGTGYVQAQGRAFTFAVPPGAGAAYVGSFPFDCPYTIARPCQAVGAPRAEAAGAHPPLPDGSAPTRTHLAEVFNLARASRGWPVPSAVAIGIDQVAVQSAVNWDDFAGRQGSRGTFRAAGGIADLGVAAGRAGTAGAIIAVPFFVVALGTVAVGGMVAGAETIHRSVVEREWRPCLDALGAQTAPGAIAPRLAAALAVPPPEAGRRGAEVSAAPWRAEVTRIVLRRCSEAGTYGVEVATRWMAPGREARFLRGVAGAPPLPGLAFPNRMPWEAEAGGPATCRPLADYCTAGGAPLVADAVVEAVAAARDALLAGRWDAARPSPRVPRRQPHRVDTR
jgi:hypothetical protein